MTAWKRHIAVLAAGIFLFPVLYQPVHIIQHHSHEHNDHSCEHKHDHEGHSCEHHHKKSEYISGETQFSQSYSDCLVCEYTFVVQDIPVQNDLVNAPVHHIELELFPTTSSDRILSFSQVNPRAPPHS